MRSCIILLCFGLLLLGASTGFAGSLDRGEAISVTSPAGGVRLNGTLRLPGGPGPFPAVVLLAERGTATNDLNSGANQLLGTLADHLLTQGVAVLRLYERGEGGSEGSAATTSLLERSADAIAALNYLRTRPQVDVTRLGLIGHGEGANVALLAGAQPLAPTFIVAVAATGLPGHELLATQSVMYGKVLGNDSTEAQRLRKYQLETAAAQAEAAQMRARGSNAAQVQTYLEQQRLRQKTARRRDDEGTIKHQRAMLEIVRQTPDDGQAQAILSNMMRQRYPGIDPSNLQTSVHLLTTPVYRNFLTFDPQPSLAQVSCPVLLLQGDDDTEVSSAVNLPLLKKGLRSNSRVTELRFPGLNHSLQLTSALEAGMSPAPIFPDAPAAIHAWISGQK